MPTSLPRRRRILVAVEPRVLGDALAAVLTDVGVDEVLVSDSEHADDPEMPIDVAVLSRPHRSVCADLIIGVDADLATASVLTANESFSVEMSTPRDLLSILDTYCPAPSLRAVGPVAAVRHR